MEEVKKLSDWMNVNKLSNKIVISFVTFELAN